MNHHSNCPTYIQPSCPNTIQSLEKTMRGEAEADEFYTYLLSMAPDEFQKNIISEIRDDERKHLNNFQVAYCMLTGHPYIIPDLDIRPPKSYWEGLMQAFKDEQEAYDFYKTNYICNTNETIKYSYLDALMDEEQHARWFNNLLIRELKENSPCHHHSH